MIKVLFLIGLVCGVVVTTTSLIMPSNILVYAQEHDLTDEELAIKVGKIEEARESLPLITAPLPMQFNMVDDMGREFMFDKIPFTKPGQIYIDIFYVVFQVWQVIRVAMYLFPGMEV